METTKEELQRNRERDEEKSKEIAKLKQEQGKRDVEFKKWKDVASAKTVRLDSNWSMYTLYNFFLY